MFGGVSAAQLFCRNYIACFIFITRHKHQVTQGRHPIMTIEIITSVIIGVLSSLVASLVWLSFYSRLRPNLVVSSQLSKFLDAEGKIAYRIKVVNRGKRHVVDVRAKLYLITPVFVPAGQVRNLQEIPLKTNSRCRYDIQAAGAGRSTHTSNNAVITQPPYLVV